MEFKEFGLADEILEGISCMGFKNATPIQEQAIPVVLSGKDLIGCAQTGTGKTGAFLLPVLSKISKGSTKKINTLIIVPTRELAVQIDQQATALSYFSGISTIPVYGGGSGMAFDQEKQALSSGADIIIATPGRLIMHMNQNYVDFSELKHLILDEADRMLDMGFYEDIMKVVGQTPASRQTLLFSATMPPKIRKLASTILKDPYEINIAVSRPAEKIEQEAYMLYEEQKQSVIKMIMGNRKPESSVIFTSSRAKVKDILRELKGIGLKAKGISSDLEQKEREEVLNEFRSKQLPILVATDVLSRGIDIEGIEIVLNYDVPAEPEDYIHRIGRTARAQATGVAITFITPLDQRKFNRIEKMMGMEITKPSIPEELGKTPEYNPAAPKPKNPPRSGGNGPNRNNPNKKRFFNKGKKPGGSES